MMKVLFVTNIPSPYRVDFFNELGKHCDLTVAFEKVASYKRDKSWSTFKFENFNGVFLKGISVGPATAICFGLKKLLKKEKFDKIICSSISSPTTILFTRYLTRKKIPYIIESDGAFIKEGKKIKEIIKRRIISKAQSCFSTNKPNDEYFLHYGAKKENIFRYPFTPLFQKDILESKISYLEKQNLRTKLGIKEQTVILSVGQFIYRKGFDVLLESVKDLPKTIGFYFVGGQPTQEYIELKQKYGLDNVYFVGFKLKEQLKEYYKASDLFVLPTREDIWGLVINEAMANALPVITTDRCGAGLELVDDSNGAIVTVNDVVSLTKAISNILLKDLEQFGKNSLEKIKDYTIEKMVERHIELLDL